MDTFTIKDLRERTDELVRDAEAGRLCISAATSCLYGISEAAMLARSPHAWG